MAIHSKLLSIIIPVKYPEPYLPQLIVDLKNFVDVPIEILIREEKGLGYAILCGIKEAKGDVLCIMDSDGSHNVNAISDMLNAIGEYDVVVGSRFVEGGKSFDSHSRKIISKAFCWLAQQMFGLNVKDSMSGFIMAKKEVFTTYPPRNSGYKILLELLVKSKGKLRVMEYPIVFEKRKMGKSKANLKTGFQTLWFMANLYASNL